MNKVLYVSGSIGMGHVTRDLAIVKEFRKLRPDVEILWLAGEPAHTAIINADEKTVPESGPYNKDSETAASTSSGDFTMNLSEHLMKSNSIWKEMYATFEKIVERKKPDLIVGDESYEITVQSANGTYVNKPKTIFIFDFVKSYAMTHKPMEMLVIWMVNRYWHKVSKQTPTEMVRSAFVGEVEDIPNERLGLFQANARDVAKGMTFVGEVLRFDPKDYADAKAVKNKLGYNDGPLIVTTIGGTTIGSKLLELCAKTYPLIKKELPNAQMVLVGGPMFDPKSISVPDGVVVKGYVPDLYEHLAASDLSIIQAGGTTIAELVALHKPFLYFPLEGHYEQEIVVAGKAERHNAGVRMRYSETTPEKLAGAIMNNIGAKVDYVPMRIGGEKRVAEMMSKTLG